MLLDTTYNIATPEGVELRLPVAGLASRSLAWLIDAMIKFAAILVFSIFLQFFGNLGEGLLLIGMFLLLWFYNVLFEIFNHRISTHKSAGDIVTNLKQVFTTRCFGEHCIKRSCFSDLYSRNSDNF